MQPETTATNERGRVGRGPRRLTSLLRLSAAGAVFSLLVGAVVLVGWFVSARRMFPFSRWVFRTMLRVAGVRLASHGVEQLDPARGYVYVFNHSSFLDHFALACQVPSFLLGVEKIESRRIPIYGFVTRWWGNIAIDRRAPEQAIRTLAAAQGVLAAGTSICIAPEGTRSRDGSVGPFRKGGFHMAVEMAAPIVPVSIVGMNQVNPDGRLMVFPGTVQLHFHAPIEVAQAEPDELRMLVRDRICAAGLIKREDAVTRPEGEGRA